MLKDAFTIFSSSTREVAVPAAYASHRSTLPSGEVSISYSRRQSDDGFDVRFVHMLSTKVDVQTLFVYPNPRNRAAVFAAETVTLGRRPTVLVADMPILNSDGDKKKLHFYQTMRALVKRHGLCNTTDVPDWYRDCRSGGDMFLRPTDSAQGVSFAACLMNMVELYQRHRQDSVTRACENPDLHSAAIQAYKKHHAEHSPGGPLMSRCFGNEWTSGFMSEFFG